VNPEARSAREAWQEASLLMVQEMGAGRRRRGAAGERGEGGASVDRGAQRRAEGKGSLGGGFASQGPQIQERGEGGNGLLWAVRAAH